MTRLGTLGLCALLCATAGCAVLQRRSDVGPSEAGRAYGAFLAAQHAVRESDRQSATEFYRTALQAAPGEYYLIERAFLDELTYGDLDEAARLAEQLVDSPSDQRGRARVVLASRAVKEGRYQRAVKLLDEDLGPFNRVVGSLVLAWAYDGLGDRDAALKVLSAPGDAPILGHMMTLHRALVLDRAGRDDEAERAYRQALASGLMSELVVDAYGRRLERSGRGADARALYVSRLSEFPMDPPARAGLERLASGEKPSAFADTPAKGASMGVYGPAAALASNAPIDGLMYLRLALYLDPENGMARERLGAMLTDAQLNEDALAVYEGVDPESPYYVDSKIGAAVALLRLGRGEDAIYTLETLADETGSPRVRRALGYIYGELDRYGDALAVYDSLIDEAQASGAAVDWNLYYARAIAYERTDQWSLAEADFQAALEIEPDEAEVLNYLGYSWVNRGERLDEAFDMIRRAVALEPDSGYIVDSLGWAHYKRGEYDVAVRHLERAVELEPQDPEINEHLGDAYWRAGRPLEASYQWRRSLTLDPEEERRVSIENKLANGLPPTEESSLLASP